MWMLFLDLNAEEIAEHSFADLQSNALFYYL